MSRDGSLLSPTQYMIALPLHSCRLWIFLMMVFEVRLLHWWQLLLYGDPTLSFMDEFYALLFNSVNKCKKALNGDIDYTLKS